MAATKSRASYIYFGGERERSTITSGAEFEFDEADLWTSNGAAIATDQPRKSIPNSRPSKKPLKRDGPDDRRPVAAASLPLDVPDWSKILPDGYGKNWREQSIDSGDEVDDDYEDSKMPPHEYLARTRTASLSVHEGIGRTLKGRDLSRVRNAIWKQIGFED